MKTPMQEERIKYLENRLISMGLSGMAYTSYWNELAKELNDLKGVKRIMTPTKTPMEEMREMEKEQIEIAVSRRFIDDNNYSKKEKDIFIEFIRNLARKEAEEKQKEFIEKINGGIDSEIKEAEKHNTNNAKQSIFIYNLVKSFIKIKEKEVFGGKE
jgi:predicted AlkP superfamily phosphohydrolase/phosphomutase